MANQMKTVSSFCYRAAMEELGRKYGEGIEILDVSMPCMTLRCLDGSKVSLGVNWASSGNVSAQDAAEFANRLAAAAAEAANHPMNGAEVIWQ